MKLNCKCGYCRDNTYIWNIQDNMVWIEIPKNASYNLKIRRFYNNPDVKMTILKSEDILKYKRGFAIIREPIERFKSLIADYFIDGLYARHRKGVEWLESVDVDLKDVNPNNLCDVVLDNWDSIETNLEPHHFNSQASFIPNEFFQINHIIFELKETSLFLGLEPNFNSSKSSEIYISEKNYNRIVQLYIDDVQLYEKYITNGRVQ